MRAHGVRRLPVVDPLGDLVGLLSLTDIAQAVLSAGLEGSLGEQVVETYAATSRSPAGPSGSDQNGANSRSNVP
jgi:CBS domain-containing protein